MMVYLADLFPTTAAAAIFFIVYAMWLFSELVTVPYDRLPFCLVWDRVVAEWGFLPWYRSDGRWHSSSTVVDCRSRALFLADRWRSRGSDGGGPRTVSARAPSRVYRIAPHDGRTRVRAAVVGGCARAYSFFRRSFRLSDSRGGRSLNIEAWRRVCRVRKEDKTAYSLRSLNPLRSPCFF